MFDDVTHEAEAAARSEIRGSGCNPQSEKTLKYEAIGDDQFKSGEMVVSRPEHRIDTEAQLDRCQAHLCRIF